MDRHEGDNVEAPIEITDEQYDSYTKSNVERWVSAHIIPVRSLPLSPFRVLMKPFQEAPIDLEGTHDTLLPGKSITFKPMTKSVKDGGWSRISLEDGIRITGKKEVCASVLGFFEYRN